MLDGIGAAERYLCAAVRQQTAVLSKAGKAAFFIRSKNPRLPVARKLLVRTLVRTTPKPNKT